MLGVGLGLGDGAVGHGDPEDVVADASGVVEHRHVEGFGLADDAAGPTVLQHGLEFGAVGVVREVLSRGVVGDLAVQVDERDAHVLGDALDAAAEADGLVPEQDAAERQSGEDERRREEEAERAFHGVRR